MDKEKTEFARRLRAALQAAGIEPSPAVVEKRFNSRYTGSAVSAQAISGWLNGKAMPKQDKLRVLASIVGLAPHELQFGDGKARIGEGRAHWAEAMAPQDLAMVDGYASLPAAQRKLVRDLVAALAAVKNA